MHCMHIKKNPLFATYFFFFFLNKHKTAKSGPKNYPHSSEFSKSPKYPESRNQICERIVIEHLLLYCSKKASKTVILSTESVDHCGIRVSTRAETLSYVALRTVKKNVIMVDCTVLILCVCVCMFWCLCACPPSRILDH